MKKLNINKKQKNIIKFIVQILAVGFAGAIGGIAFKTFFEAVGIIPTGLSGLALIISNGFLNAGINISTTIVYLVMNIILFGFALKLFGWKFLVLSGVGITSYILGMQFGYIPALIPDIANEKLLYSIVGAIIVGISIGVALRFGGSTGGSDITGVIINRYFPKIKTGYCILIINCFVLILTIITGGVQTALYALVISIISSMATNLVLDSSKRVLAYYIICDKDEEISNAILDKYHRGVTKLKAVGMYSKQNKSMLLCLIPNEQAGEMKKLVAEIDSKAFVFSAPVTETIGEGNFMKEQSAFKNRIKKASIIMKTDEAYNQYLKPKKSRRKKKIYTFKSTISQNIQTTETFENK